MKNPLTPEWLDTPSNLSDLDPRIWPRTAKRNERGELLVGGQTASDLSSSVWISALCGRPRGF